MKKALVLLFALIIAAIPAFSSGGAEVAGTLVYGTTEKVTDMDPANAYDFHTWEIFQNVYQGLVAYAPGTTDLVPALAESWSANDKGNIFTFKLRQGLRFADGTPFTANTVVWTINRNANLGGDPSWLITDFVQSVKALDNLTVEFTLKGPIAYFPKLLPNPPYFPLNPNVYPVDKIVKDPTELKGGQMMGLGPYKIVSFKRDEEVVLEANPNFWGKEPKIKQIIIRYFADATTMRLALEKGEIDLAYKTMNPSDIADLQKNASLTTFKLPGPYIRYLCFETSESVFKDKGLRQAVAALINRPEIVQKVFLGQNSPLYSMVPNGMIYHTDNYKTAWGDGNVAAAEKILSGLGYSKDKPFAFDLWYTPTHYGDTEVNVAEVMKAQLEKTPMVKVTIKSAEWATYKEQWKNKQMASFLLGWYPDYVDPDNYTAAFAGTSGSKGMGINFSNKEWDSLFDAEQTDTTEAIRSSVFAKIQKMWTDENPTVPIFQGDLYVFTKKNVSGVKIGPPLIFNYDQLMMTK
jgi:peptide/nickel transport system substrate-binding protein